MKEEAQEMLEALEAAFQGINGPPAITLSVARGLDDHQYSKLGELAKEHRHHRHWNNVTPEEMDKYHDCWAFMDAEAVRFYLPAFIARHLENIVKTPTDRTIEANWFPLECITLSAEKLKLLNKEQADLVTNYLCFIENNLQDECARELFRPTRQAWETNIRLLNQKQT